MRNTDPSGTHTQRYPTVSNRKPLIINANEEKLMKPATVIQFTLLLVTCFLSAFYVQALDASDEFKILASDGAAADWFGYSVSISGDTAIVGALYDDENGEASGTYFYTLKTAGYVSTQKMIILK